MTRKDISQFIRFVVVGASAVALNVALYALLVGMIRVPYLWATAIIFFIGNAYGFAANRIWTFSRCDRPLGRLALYYLTMLTSLGANLMSMVALVEGLGFHYLIGSVLTSVWLAPIQYMAHRQLAFRTDSAAPRTDLMLVTNYFPEHGGGAEIVSGELSRRLARSWEIRWYAAGPAEAPTPPSVARVSIGSWNGIERRLGLPIPIPTPGGIRRVVSGVRAARVIWIHDIIYIANIVAAIAAFAYRRPLFVTVHVGTIPYRRRAVRMLMAGILATVGPVILKRAHGVAFVSDRVRRDFVTRWSLRGSHLIPNGVDSSIFRPPSETERQGTRAVLGFQNQPIALFVGRFVERKGLDFLRDLARETPSIQWLLAGDGPLNPDGWLLPNVHVLGPCPRERIAQLYGAADLVVLPSVGEGFPLVVQEALATGARVIVDPSTAAGSPGAERYLMCESVTEPRALARWQSRVSRLVSTTPSAEERQRRADFARRQWDWDVAADAYRAVMQSSLQSVHSGVPTPAQTRNS